MAIDCLQKKNTFAPMNTNKKGVRIIAETCMRKGIRKVVFSPGSRSAPLVIAFSQIKEVECIVIPDERSAGYFALGMAQQLGETVVVVCTSGTAVLNLAPAVCEAFYQQVPLLILTADRPQEAVEKGENQAIIQDNIFGHFALSLSVNGDAEGKKELIGISKDVCLAINNTRSSSPIVGHINVRMAEPLYQTTSASFDRDLVYDSSLKENFSIKQTHKKHITRQIQNNKTVMLVVGLKPYNSDFNKRLNLLSKRNDIIILAENISNVRLSKVVRNTDACISLMNEEDSFQPDLVVTLGGAIVSKKLKQFLNGKPKLHWDIPSKLSFGKTRAMFGSMYEEMFPVNEIEFLDAILNAPEKPSSFRKNWLDLSQKAELLTANFLKKARFSDLKAFQIITSNFPDKANIQLGNSTPVRYTNLLPYNTRNSFNANRGTSGIDGCLSTAAGAAHVNRNKTVCITGDVSFFYDSNALWNNYLSPDFRIIILNNSGGNIFRLIDGPGKVKDFEIFFETAHNLNAKHLAGMYDLPYYFCDSTNKLESILQKFYQPQKGRAAILEIKTNNEISAATYKAYFEFLKQHKS